MMKKLGTLGRARVRDSALMGWIISNGLEHLATKIDALGVKTLDDIHQLEETDLTPEAGFSVVDKRKFIAARKLLKDADYIETNGVEVKRARVLFDYDKVKANQLSIKEGDVVIVDDDSKAWWKVTDQKGDQGTVPSNYLEIINEEAMYEPVEEPTPPPRRQSQRGTGGRSGDSVGAPAVSRRAKPALPGAAPTPELPDYEIEIQPGDPMYEPPPISPPSLYMDGAAIPKPPPAMRKRTEDLKVVPETAPLPPNPNDWIPQEVKRWLKSENLDEFIDVFYANGFDGAKMMTLSASQFVAGGFDEAACNLLGQAMERLKQSLDKKKKARAVYEYVGQKPGQLSLREGEIVTVLDDKKAWWKARNSQGQEGKVPSNYLEIVPDEEVSAVVEPQQLHYYHPNISRQEAEQKVAESREVGSFLIRESSTGEGFTLTAKTATGVMNLKVTKDGNHYVLGLFSGRYTNLDDLIQFHRSNPIRIANKDPMMLTMAVRRQ